MEYNDVILADEEQNRKRGLLLSIVLHLLLILLCFTTFFSEYEKPDDQISGIVVQLGIIEGGNTSEVAQSEESPANEEETPAAPELSAEEEKSTAKTVVPEKVEEAKKASPEASTESQTTQEKSDIIAKKAKEKSDQAAKKKKAAEAQKAAEEKAEKEAERKAEEEAKRKAAAAEAKKKAEYEAKKSKFGSLLSGGSGNNDNSGNQGDPNGDPNSKALDNLATGSGLIGEGLSDRSVEYKPVITDNSQKTGRVVIDICIDAKGKVISSKYTQKGSTSADKELIEVAEKGVLQYRFSSSSAAKQCGSIIIDFKLK